MKIKPTDPAYFADLNLLLNAIERKAIFYDYFFDIFLSFSLALSLSWINGKWKYEPKSNNKAHTSRSIILPSASRFW